MSQKTCRKCGADAGGLGWRYTKLRGVGLASPNVKRVYCRPCAVEAGERLRALDEARRIEAGRLNRIAREANEIWIGESQ